MILKRSKGKLVTIFQILPTKRSSIAWIVQMLRSPQTRPSRLMPADTANLTSALNAKLREQQWQQCRAGCHAVMGKATLYNKH